MSVKFWESRDVVLYTVHSFKSDLVSKLGLVKGSLALRSVWIPGIAPISSGWMNFFVIHLSILSKTEFVELKFELKQGIRSNSLPTVFVTG